MLLSPNNASISLFLHCADCHSYNLESSPASAVLLFLTASGAVQTADQGKQGSLSTSGRAENGIEFPLLHLSVDSTQDVPFIVVGISHLFQFHDTHSDYLVSLFLLCSYLFYSICDKICFGFSRIAGIQDTITEASSRAAPTTATIIKCCGVTMTWLQSCRTAFPASSPLVCWTDTPVGKQRWRSA